eukprot:TRINITY_DN19670_c0_g1_i1.p1 TRINITY_DN19670_c0_g1~~TRINITY_DN19670_c0_g1_i1.p1  ORF type:complete len:733 (+),score=151.90 TRINITY_DN19670_c0_g1_i1:196-2199(+)
MAAEREAERRLREEQPEEADRRARAARVAQAFAADDDSSSRSASRSRSRSLRRRSRSRSRGRQFETPSMAPTPAAPVSFTPGNVSPEPASASKQMKPGGRVRLTGLKAAAALNGSTGILEKFDSSSERWEVKLEAGDIKAIRPDNLIPLEDEEDVFVPPKSPEAEDNIAPKSPPPAPPSQLTGRAGGATTSAAAQRAAAEAKARAARRMGTIRFYNGRRKLGAIIPDGANATTPDLFIPAQGAPNGSQVPPQPGGLFHGTRVSFLPMAINKTDPFAPAGQKAKEEIVCMDVRPLAGQVGLSCGVDTNKGAKESNDDRLAAQDLHELGFMTGVFDGHRGSQCADFVSKHIGPAILSAYRAKAKREGSLVKLSSTKEASLISSAMAEAFEATDQAWQIAARKKGFKDGSTGLVALVSHGFEVAEAADAAGCAALWPKPKEPAKTERKAGTVATAPGGVAKLFLAWAGDCRCILMRGRQGLRVSEDHRPQRQDEKRRIEKAGGIVVQDAHKIWRVGPRPDNKLARELSKGKRDPAQMKMYLSTCRGFGDTDLKHPDPIVIATPEVKAIDLVPEDWAVVLACDGVFDVLSDQEVADIIWRGAAGEGKDAVRNAREVVAAALRKGSRDNITAIVMRLNWSPPPTMDAASAAVASAGLDLPPEPAKDDTDMFG